MEAIKQLLLVDKTDEAICLLERHLENHPQSDEAYYLLGNAYRKLGDFKSALNNYLKALELNPDSPATIAYKQMINILNFYHKDRFNH